MMFVSPVSSHDFFKICISIKTFQIISQHFMTENILDLCEIAR